MNRKALASRLVSWVWDYLVVLAWVVVVFIAVGVPQLTGWLDLTRIWSRPLTADLTITVLTVLPYLAYLVATEAGPEHATFGKRRTGLVVSNSPDGVTFRRALVRNTVKVLPWQLGHMSAMRFATQPEVGIAAILMFTTSMLLLVAAVLPPLLGRRGLHDRIAGTAVQSTGVRAAAPPHAAGAG